VLTTPRGELLDAPLRWFELQREWWKGGKGRLKPFEPLPEDPWTRDLTNDRKIRYLPDAEQAPDDFPQAGFDDSTWTDGKVDVWTVPEEQPYKHALMRRQFTVPAEWNSGEIDLYIKSWNAGVGMGKLRVCLDGREILKPDNGSINGLSRRITAEVEPGKSYILAIEVFGEGMVPGLRGNVWMSFVPKPIASMDLAGLWTPSKDALVWTEPVQLPGRWQDALLAKRTITIPAELEGKKVCFRMRSTWGLTGVIVNGRYVRRHHHIIGEFTHLNITPFLQPGENEIEIAANMNPTTTDLTEISLDFYDPDFVYP